MGQTKFTILCLWTTLRSRSLTPWDAPWRGWGPRFWCRNRMRSRYRVRPHSKSTTELTISLQLKTKTISCEDRSLRWSALSVSPTRSSLTSRNRSSLLRVSTTSTKPRRRENCSNCNCKWRKLSKNCIYYTLKCVREDYKCPLPNPPTGFLSTRDRSRDHNLRRTLSKSSASWKTCRGS